MRCRYLGNRCRSLGCISQIWLRTIEGIHQSKRLYAVDVTSKCICWRGLCHNGKLCRRFLPDKSWRICRPSWPNHGLKRDAICPRKTSREIRSISRFSISVDDWRWECYWLKAWNMLRRQVGLEAEGLHWYELHEFIQSNQSVQRLQELGNQGITS